jgi:hypothetical protein
MSREIVNAICRTLPGAEVSDPWGGGHDAWKIGGKMFACIGAVMPGECKRLRGVTQWLIAFIGAILSRALGPQRP